MPRKRKVVGETSENNSNNNHNYDGNNKMGQNGSKKKRNSFEEEQPANPTSLTKSRSGSFNSNEKESAVFQAQRCSNWFEKYKDSDESEGDVIGPDGIEKFCSDLGLTPDNIQVLLIAWKLQAQTMGYFTKEEWMSGMRKMNCDSVTKLKNHLPKLKAEMNDANSFKDIYRYSFDFSKEKGQKSMDINTAQAMLLLLMKDKYQHTEPFVEFLQEKTPVKVINKDQWMNFLEFCEAIAIDLSNYDEMSAWPVLLDEYLSCKKEKQAAS
jgi:DCN1-like protein 4/5